MKRVRSVHVASRVGERVRVCGWLHSHRKLGGISFLVIRDGFGLVQALANEAAQAALKATESQLKSVIEVEGIVVAEPQAPGGAELHEITLSVLSPVREPVPILLHKKLLSAQLPALLEHAVVTHRHPSRRAVFRLASAAVSAFRCELKAQEFVEIHTPKLVESATEGGANVFQLDYFGRAAYLAQSPQFYKQIMVGVFERVYEIGPVFRAEPHDTTRHINQYTSLDAELGFIHSHRDVMAVLTSVLRTMFAELREVAQTLSHSVDVPEMTSEIPELHFTEAQEMLAEHLGEHERGQPDLSPEGERWLGAWARAKHNSELLFVTGYPMRKRPFYTHPDPERSEYSNSFDLLFRGTELVTGGQRLHRLEAYEDALRDRGLDRAPFEHYLETFRFGMPPHGGFAIGLERFLMQLLGLSNIRLATLFPRDLHRLSP